MMVPQADHFFNGRYKELDKAVREFLDQVLR
jgi:alpha/beta superfamily hydrolase